MRYKITFLDYWHVSSGMSAGVKFDSLITKDDNNLPFISGKTIKGVVREQFEKFDSKKAKELFGDEGVKEARLYFTNATISKNIANKIIKEKLQDYLYDIITSTAIDNKTGVAKDYSLRDIEVVVPICLEGEILNVKKEDKDVLLKALKSVKRLGLNRHRGLGRCKIEEIV